MERPATRSIEVYNSDSGRPLYLLHYGCSLPRRPAVDVPTITHRQTTTPAKMLRRVALAAATAAAAVDATPPQPQDGAGMQRIYFQSWNVGAECSSTPGCREAATAYLANGTGANPMAFEPSEAAVFATIGLVAADSSAVDLTQHGYLKGKGYTQVDGLCRAGKLGGDAASLTFRPGFTVVKKDGGCLSKEGLLSKSQPHAFAVALVKPPKVNPSGTGTSKYFGGVVKSCPDGICMLAVSVPAGGVVQGADKVAAVCGQARHRCTVGLGDFGVASGSDSATIADHWKQLTGDTGNSKIFVTGPDRANLASNIPGQGRGMNVGQGFPLAKQFGNGTTGGTTSSAELMDQLFPCQYPGAFVDDGCTK